MGMAVPKIVSFHVISPAKDRRREGRFEAREPVAVRTHRAGRAFPMTAHEVGRHGLRLGGPVLFNEGRELEISFPYGPGHVECVGQVVWSRSIDGRAVYECGIAVGGWFGVVDGAEPWMVHRRRPTPERRRRPR